MDAERVELGNVRLIGLEGTWGAEMTAFGSRDAAPFLVTVSEDGNSFHELTLPGSGRVTSVAGFEETLAVVHDVEQHVEPEGSADGPRLFAIGLPDGSPDLAWNAADDEWTTSATRLWVVCGDEDPAYVVMDTAGRLTAVDEGGEGPLPTEGQLWLPNSNASLLVSQEDVSVVLAGDIGEAGAGFRPSAWVIDIDGTREVRTEVEVDGFTDIGGRGHLFIAGHHQGRPVVLDILGHAVPTPPAELDEKQPTVLIATPPHGTPSVKTAPSADGMVLVVRALDGLQAWACSSEEWHMTPLPGTTLQAARTGFLSVLWLVADHALWRIAL